MMSPVRKLSDRHPFEIYVLVWALVTSFPAAVGVTDVPASMSRQLPGWPARAWAIALTVGCLTALVGLVWPRPAFPFVSPTALGMEQVGLTIVGVAAVLYAVAALFNVGWSALVPAGVIVGFGFACFAQCWKIDRVLRQSRPAP